MAKNFRLRLSVQEWSDSAMYRAAVARLAGLSTDTDFVFKELRRTIDARSRNIKIETEVTVFDDGEEMPASLRALPDIFIPKSLEKTAPVLITGAGPAGLFARHGHKTHHHRARQGSTRSQTRPCKDYP
jgi:hypothetical protein